MPKPVIISLQTERESLGMPLSDIADVLRVLTVAQVNTIEAQIKATLKRVKWEAAHQTCIPAQFIGGRFIELVTGNSGIITKITEKSLIVQFPGLKPQPRSPHNPNAIIYSADHGVYRSPTPKTRRLTKRHTFEPI